MSKKISQETFDEVVEENMRDFDMNAEDAVAEAVSQFLAQGVCLDSIVKQHRPSMNGASGDGSGPVKHKVVELIEQLEALKDSDNCDDIVKPLAELTTCCDEDLAQRCLAAKSGAYMVVIKCIKAGSTVAALKCLSALVHGQPDILDDSGSTRLIELLALPVEPSAQDTERLTLTLEVITRCCTMHEANRQRFVSGGLPEAVGRVLKGCEGVQGAREAQGGGGAQGGEGAQGGGGAQGGVVRGGCAVICSLVLDDDPRVPFGKAHEHAKILVNDVDCIRALMGLSAGYQDNVDILGDIFVAVGKLAVRDEFCLQVLDNNGVKNLLAALQNNISKPTFVRSCLSLLKSLCGSDSIKSAVVQEGGAELMCECLERHVKSAAVCEIGCAALAALVLRHPAHCVAAMESRAAYCLVKVLDNHSTNINVLKQGSMAIRNLVSRCPEHRAAFLELGVEPILRKALDAADVKSGCKDELKAALRDLGCSVQLEEQWKGTGRNLAVD